MRRWYFYGAVIAATVILGLSGCSSWNSGSYVSITQHQQWQPTQSEGVRVSTFAELRSALRQMVDNREETGTILLENYDKDLEEADIRRVTDDIQNGYPMSVYAVDEFSLTQGSGVNASVLTVDIRYSKTKEQMDEVSSVQGKSSIRSAIGAALEDCSNSVVLQISGYEETDYDQMVKDYAELHPDVVMEIPQVLVRQYPESGEIRIVELSFSYENSRDALRNMQAQVVAVFESAEKYINSEAEDILKYAQIYTFLMDRFDYTLETSITPSYSLLHYGVGDSKAFAQIYAAMCRRVKLNCSTVLGTRNGEPWYWNIIKVNDIYYYVDLLRFKEEDGFRQLVDTDMENYVWDYSAYPSCGVKQSLSDRREQQGMIE